jgi:hypothetical protein
MNELPLLSSDPELSSRIRACLAECRFDTPGIQPLVNHRQAMDHMKIDLPELVLVHFPDQRLNAHGVLNAIMSDPWLIHGGIIALCDDDDAVEHLESIRGANLIAILSTESMGRQLPRVLDIIQQNRRILFQREIGSDLLPEISGRFELENDVLEARCYTNLVCNFLYNSNRIDERTKDALNLAMYEMLLNAIEHGNCGITHEEKTRWMEQHGSTAKLIEQRSRQREIADRRVVFEYAISPGLSRFSIGDEGRGFDWRAAQDATSAENLLKTHGRGILMSRAVTRNLSYNSRGNKVRFEIEHQRDQASMTPGLIRHMKPREVQPGEVVFHEGDPGNSLYYIGKGRYEVTVGDQVVASLSPDDMFLGEMSFLLKNRRNATIRALTAGTLIEITKRNFVEAVKDQPHYALLLCRLLAQRVARGNRLALGLSSCAD